MTSAADLMGMLPGYFTIEEVKGLPAANAFTIKAAGRMTVGRGDKAEEKPVVTFTESQKGLVLNKARAQQLSALFGRDPLVGKKVHLGVATIDGREQIAVSATAG